MRLGTLSPEEQHVEERIRTLSQALCGVGVVAVTLYYLRSVMIPLVLAIALKYLLQPLVAVLMLRPLTCCGATCCRRAPALRGLPRFVRPCLRSVLQCKLPHGLAVLLALGVAFAVLGLLGFIVADSVHTFSRHSQMYSERVQELGVGLLGWMDTMQAGLQADLGLVNRSAAARGGAGNGTDGGASDLERMRALAGKVPVTAFVLSALQSIMEALSNLLLVLLFAVFMLLSSPPVADDAQADGVHKQADAQINAYIRGKVAISLLVGALSAVALLALGVDLWLVFGCERCAASSRRALWPAPGAPARPARAARPAEPRG